MNLFLQKLIRRLSLILQNFNAVISPLAKTSWSFYFSKPYNGSTADALFEIQENYKQLIRAHTICADLPDNLLTHVLYLGEKLCISGRRSVQICNHGLILSSLLYQYIEQNTDVTCLNIFETGTAKGFSTFCMSETLDHLSIKNCRIFTCDLMPHNIPSFWDLPSDALGKLSRSQLMEKYGKSTQKYAIYLECSSRNAMSILNLQRINFAFLDAGHKASDIKHELIYTINRQQKDDMIVIDDYSKTHNFEFSKTVDDLCNQYNYSLEIIPIYPLKSRCFAVAKKL